jgi:S-adenosylmethionine synthetase
MKKNFLFTSESVTDGHPDRLCDSISDAVVDRFLQKDPYSRIIAECALSKNVLFLAARFATEVNIDIPDVAREVMAGVDYRAGDFDAANCSVLTSLIKMPANLRAQRDEKNLSRAELDHLTVHSQVSVFGYACTQTPELMPLPISLANRLARELAAARRNRKMGALSPDCTVQVGVEYANGAPCRIPSITIIAGSVAQHAIEPVELRELLVNQVITPMFASETIQPDEDSEIFINPQGAFPKSGPGSHSGMTGRKTAADTYGAYARHSGSALSGKDPTRIDRVGAYMARHVAKNVVAAGLARQCEVQLSYAIGHAGPISVGVHTFGTAILDEQELTRRVEAVFDFRLGAIIREFNLRHLPALHPAGFYQHLPVNGHFGGSGKKLPWENTDKAESLR